MYNVDYKRLVMHLLPTFFRQPCIFGLLRAALVPLEQLHSKFLAKRKAQIYRLTHNGQVCYLTAVLNDNFPSAVTRFSIASVERQGEWLYAVSETGESIQLTAEEGELVQHIEPVGNRRQPRVWYEIVGGDDVPLVYDEIALNAAQSVFIVNVPIDIYGSPASLLAVKEMVNRYKLVSKHAVYRPVS